MYGMTVVTADAWTLGKIHIAYVSHDWNIPALEIRPERRFADILGLRTRKERESCLLSTEAIGSVGNYVLLRAQVNKMTDYMIHQDKRPMALPWVLWMPVVSHDGEDLGIVEDAYIDTDLWKVDTLTFVMDRRPYQKLRTLSPAPNKRRTDIPSSLAILGDVILLKVRTMELNGYLKGRAAQEVATSGASETA